MEEPSAAHFLEKFAFAEDRKLVLKELIPGTKEFYFYHGLVALQEGDVEAAKALWADFTSKDPLGSDHEPMQELLCRLRISQWGQSDEDTRACVDYLLKELKLNLDHQQHTVSGRTILDKNLDLPSSLAPDQASAKSLLSDPSLELTQAGCTWAMRENRPLLLKNLHNVTRPIPGIEALPEVYSVDFGSLPVHTQLTLHQLDKILEMNPDHGRGMVFLRCYTGKCAPSPDVLADVDNDELARYYDRLEPLTKHSAHLRALVLLGRMKIGRRCGRYDPALLRKYLEIPKCDGEAYMGRMADTMNGAVRISSNPFQVISPDNIPEASIVHEYFDANFRQLGGAGVLPPAQTHRLPPGADVAARAAAVSAAVRAELQPWEDLVRAGLLDYKFLLGVLAEAKLTSGGDVELWSMVLRMSQSPSPLPEPVPAAATWHSELASPSSLAVERSIRTLVERIDIDFATWNPLVFHRADAVSLDVHIKNVSELMVKLFEVNTYNYFSKHGDDLAGIDLDGLTAGYETVVQFTDDSGGPVSPLSRVLRRVSFPHLQGKAGAFVVELIGNGKKARAVIRKGCLRYIERASVAGHALRVFREDGSPAGDSLRAFVQGREYGGNATGEVIVPFTTEPGQKRILLCEGNVTTVESFEHKSRSFSLDVGVWMDGESLIPGHEATLLLRPRLYLNELAVPLELLEDASVSLRWSALEKNDIVQDILISKLADGSHVSRTVKVPNRTSLHVTFRGRVTAKARPEQALLSSPEKLAAGASVSIHRMTNVYLRCDATGYHLCVLGWGGEPLPETLVHVRLRHRFRAESNAQVGSDGFYSTRNVNKSAISLCSDRTGEVHLGLLKGVASIKVEVPSISCIFSQALQHEEFQSAFSSPSAKVVQGRVGDVLRVPYRCAPAGEAGVLLGDKEGIQLLEIRGPGGYYSEDMTNAHVVVTEGWVELHGLPAGDFELYMPWYDASMAVRVVAPIGPGAIPRGEQPLPSQGYVIGAARTINASMAMPLTLANISEDQGDLVIQLAGNLGQEGLVHVAFYHFAPPDNLSESFLLDGAGQGWPWFSCSRAYSTAVYHPAQTLNSELMYVVERRRGGGLRTGNMLPRPQLLMHPREVQETETLKMSEPDTFDRDFRFCSGSPGQFCSSERYMAHPDFHQFGSGGNDEYPSPPPRFCPAPILVTNLRPDDTGLVCIRKSARTPCHTLARILVVDDALGQAIKCEFALAPEPNFRESYKDLALQKALEPSKNYVQHRCVSIVSPGSKFTVQDLHATKIQPYDTLKGIHALFSAFIESGAQKQGRLFASPSDTKEKEQQMWKTFSFVTKWPSLKEQEKLTLLQAHACHELHLFLYFKDRPFFDARVVPALRSKMDRSFLDEWMLNNSANVLAWVESSNAYWRLNAAEKSLLAGALHAHGRLEEAQQVARDVEDSIVGSEPLSVEDADRRFEVAIAATGESVTDAASPPESAEEDEGGGGVHTSRLRAHGVQFEAPVPMVASAPKPPRMQASRARTRMLMSRDVEEEDYDQFKADIEVLEEQAPLYEPPAWTKQLAETHYWKRSLVEQTANLVPANAFWADFARHQASGGAPPFLSTNVLEAGGSFTGSMFALAVLDLPFEVAAEGHGEAEGSSKADPSHSITVSGPSLSFSPSWPLILFEEGIRELPPVPAGSSTSAPSLMASHILLEVQPLSNEAYENASKVTLVRGGALQTGKVYAIAVVLVKMSVEDEDITASILVQIPKGAVPLSPKGYTVCEPLTERFFGGEPVIVVAFYFPKTGKYPQLPAQVFQRRKAAATAPSGAPGVDNAGEMELVAVAAGAAPELTVISDEEVEAAAVAKGMAEGWGDGPQAWPAISSHASDQQLLTHLCTANLHALDLTMMAWRMREPRFCSAALDVLRKRHIFVEVLFAYGVLHGDVTAVRDLLQHSSRLASLLRVSVFDSAVLQLQPGAAGLLTMPSHDSIFEHMEFHPLLNARVHAFGEKREGVGRIQNREFAQHYTRLLEICSRRKHLSSEEALQAAYCFLLQDRIDEAKAMYSRALSRASDSSNPRSGITINPAPPSTPITYTRLQMQADYLAAYLDFFSSDPAASVARQVAIAYRDCPIPSWRLRFAEIEAQLTEAEEEVQGLVEKSEADDSWEMLEKDPEESFENVDDNNRTDSVAGHSTAATRGKSAPVLELRQLSDGSLLAEYAHIDGFTVNVYILDLELLFSDNPFVSHDTDAFTVIMPNWSSSVDTRGGAGKLGGGDGSGGASAATGPRKSRGSTAIDIPEEHRARNVLVEVTGGGLRRTFVRYSTTAIWVEVMESMGELKVMKRVPSKPSGDDVLAKAATAGMPMRGAYVKVFARLKDKGVAFYKDGYTDRRGRFDYASVSADDLKSVERFSLLVVADGLGSLIKEAAPPAR